MESHLSYDDLYGLRKTDFESLCVLWSPNNVELECDINNSQRRFAKMLPSLHNMLAF